MERAWARALRPEPNSWLAVNKPNFEKLKEWSILNLIVFIGKKLGLEVGLREILAGSSGLDSQSSCLARAHKNRARSPSCRGFIEIVPARRN